MAKQRASKKSLNRPQLSDASGLPTAMYEADEVDEYIDHLEARLDEFEERLTRIEESVRDLEYRDQPLM